MFRAFLTLKQPILLRCSQHRSWDDSLTYRLGDYWLGCREACFLAGD